MNNQPTASQRNPENTRLALLWMTVSAVAFTVMSVFVKRLSPHYSHIELVFYRSLISLGLATFLMWKMGESFFPKRKTLLLFRGLAGFIAVTAFFYTLGHLPLSIASLLNWLSPLFVILFSRAFLKERLEKNTLLKISLAFLGLLLVIKPDSSDPLTSVSLAAVGIGLLGSASAALAYVAVRAATLNFSVHTIIYFFAVVATTLSTPFAMATFHLPKHNEIIELLIMGGCATLGQYTMTQGYRNAVAGVVSSMNLLNAVCATLIGWLLFGELLSFQQIVGMVLVCLGVASASWKGRPKPQVS